MNRQETIIRGQRDADHPYFASARATPQDTRLSWEARGVLWYLLSKPGDWQLVIADLEQNCGRDKVYRIIRELMAFGYIERPAPSRDDKGRWVWEPYRVFEFPRPTSEQADDTDQPADSPGDDPEDDSPHPENPYTDFPDADLPYTANTEINKIENLQNRDKDSMSSPCDDSQVSSEDSPIERTFSENDLVLVDEAPPVGKVTGVKDGKIRVTRPNAAGSANMTHWIKPDRLTHTDQPCQLIEQPKPEVIGLDTEAYRQVFEAVCIHVFETSPDMLEEDDSSRIGMIAAWLGGKRDRFRGRGKVGYIRGVVAPEHVIGFVHWWGSAKNGASVPRDVIKFIEAWREYATAQKQAARIRTLPTAHRAMPLERRHNLSHDQINADIAAARAAMRGVTA